MINQLSTKTILSIDTSCDETSIAITSGQTILSNIVSSQVELHQQYGGVFPTVAKQAHKDNFEPTLKLAFKRAQKTWADIDAVAVTVGPGLAPALEIGINKAKELSKKHQLPLLAVNHIEGHLLSVLAEANSRSKKTNNPLENDDKKSRTDRNSSVDEESSSLPLSSNNILPKFKDSSLQTLRNSDKKNNPSKYIQSDTQEVPASFPVLGIIVSGGHTEFILVKELGNYQRLGWTIDDAAGEALDKVGRMLNLGYPAGSVIEEFAKKGDSTKYKFPLPMTTSKDYNLSFSGLKTFSRNLIADLETKDQVTKQTIFDLAASLQFGVFRHINHKLEKVLQDYPEIQEVWLGGGVAANISLRQSIRQTIKKYHRQNRQKGKVETTPNIKLRSPYTKKLCGDNAAMIGVVGARMLAQNQIADPSNVDRRPKWRVNES